MRIGPSTPAIRPQGPAEPLRAVAAPAKAAPSSVRSLGDRLSGFFHSALTFVRHLFQPFGTWTNPNAKAPADTGGLKAVTYNVMVKTTNLDAVGRDLEKYGADVVTLQETSEETARRLAERLGMHLAWQEDPFHAYGGTAILSKFPIAAAERLRLHSPFSERFGEFWKRLKAGEPRMAPMDARFGTHVTLKVGDRAVDVLTGHLTLFGQGQNTEQMAQLHDLSASLQKQGHTVVLTGDWNTNMAAVEPESTLGHPTAGNTASPANRAAIQRLMGDMNYYWDAPNRTVLVDGTLMTPEQARAELQSGKVDPKSERYRQLEQAADGSTVLSAYKRFDNVFTSKDARIESAFIDQTTRASDHQPVVTDIRWD